MRVSGRNSIILPMTRYRLESLTEYTVEAILQEIRRAAEEYGKGPFTSVDFTRLRPRVSRNTILRRIGPWERALELAGLTHLSKSNFPTPYQEQLTRGAAMSDAQLLEELRRVQKLTGRVELTKTDFNRLSLTRYEVVLNRFGGWHNALQLAGIERSDLGKRYSDEECLRNIAELWTYYGRQPRYDELKRPPSSVGPKAYIGRWRSWRMALGAFVEWANGGDSQEMAPRETEPAIEAERTENTKERISAETRREVPLRLKWQVHVRDRFRCVACGKNPSQHGVTLHADHIQPWADDGPTTIENLQTLCEACNLAKGRSYAKAI